MPTSVNKDCTPCPACYYSHSSLSQFSLLCSPSTHFVFQMSACHFFTGNVNQRNCLTILFNAALTGDMIDNSFPFGMKRKELLLYCWCIMHSGFHPGHGVRQSPVTTPCFIRMRPTLLTPHNLSCSHILMLILFPYRINCYPASNWHCLHSLQRCMFEYYNTFTLGIWSLLLNAHDLFFHLILLSITTSWCNAPVNPYTLTICLCGANNTALHAAWMTIMTNTEYFVLCGAVLWFSHC